MRTNGDLGEALLRKAFQCSKAKTKKEPLHEALEELIASRQRLDLRELKGKVAFRKDYDYKKMRKAG